MEIFVDGELESLLGMFNFEQEKTRDKDEMLSLSTFYNNHDHDHNDMFPFGAMPCGNLPAMLDSCDHNHIQHKQKETTLKRKLNFDHLFSNSNVSSEEELLMMKKQKISLESNSLSNSSDDEKASVTSKSTKGKSRATKGTATDPQSLYARKRREKINERLKTLQKLVPNGTKVDISTMLEEAVQYVKFLQLQIKLLSSDDLWMYAPLAYNGLDFGFHHNLLSRFEILKN